MIQENFSEEMTTRSRFVRLAFIVALTMLSLFLLAETVRVIKNISTVSTPAVDTIVVNGVGSAYATADTATVSYTIKKTSANVSDAQADVTKTENSALAKLKKQGVADADVRTTNYSISPHYEYRSCVNGYCPPAKINGYSVSQTVSVKIHKLSIVGKVLRALGTVGVSNLSGPKFIVNDTESVKSEARFDAISKAKAKAINLSKQLGVSLVRIVRYNEYSKPRQTLYGMSVGAVEKVSTNASVPVLPTGQNKYTVNVSITYEIR